MWFRRRRSDAIDKADEALADSLKSLRATKDRGPEVTTIAQGLKDLRERNHFAENLEEIIRRRGLQP